MAINKYINTSEVVELTGCTTSEVLNLAKTGVLSAHKTRRGHWRFSVDAVEKYFGIQVNKPEEETIKTSGQKVQEEKLISGLTARKYLNCSKSEFERLVKKGLIQAHRDELSRWRVVKESILDYIKQPSKGASLILNGNHYQEVIQRLYKAKSSIRIMTADFKRFRLKPTIDQGKDYSDGTPFIKFLMFKAVQGVSVQIICSRPSETFLEEWSKYYDQMGHPELFSSKFCIRNHCKAVIIDDKIAYVGSANATPAGLGQGIFTPGNFEVGIFTEKKEIISSLKELFSNILEGEFCSNCHRINRCREKCGPWDGSLIRRK